MLCAVGSAPRTVSYGIVAGLVVSQANWALFEDLVNRQSSFDAVGWGNWFLYLLVPIVAGGVLVHRGRFPAEGGRNSGRAALASFAGLAVTSVLLRILTPVLLHRGSVIPDRLPRTLADGFTLVAQYGRLAPLAGQGDRFEVVAAMASAAIVCAAVAIGALAFENRLEPVLAAAVTGAVLAGLGWFVPGGAGARIIGALWPPLVLGAVGAAVALTDQRRAVS